MSLGSSEPGVPGSNPGGPTTLLNHVISRPTDFISLLQRFTLSEQPETSDVVFMPDRRKWWETVDPARLSEDARYRILAYAVEKYERKRVRKDAGISKVKLWRLFGEEELDQAGVC